MKIFLSLDTQRKDISVVSDQVVTPTNALELAKCLVKIIYNTSLIEA
jgi:dTDP-4-dehydrorhamnose reductase